MIPKILRFFSIFLAYFFKIVRKTVKIGGVLQKFCTPLPFQTCGNTVAPKLRAHVIEGIPNAHVKFCRNLLKIDSCAQRQAMKFQLVCKYLIMQPHTL